MDEELKPLRLKRHLISTVTQVKHSMMTHTVLQRIAAVHILVMYKRALQKPPDSITAARCASETMRTLRGLGVLTERLPGPNKPAGRRFLDLSWTNKREEKMNADPRTVT